MVVEMDRLTPPLRTSDSPRGIAVELFDDEMTRDHGGGAVLAGDCVVGAAIHEIEAKEPSRTEGGHSRRYLLQVASDRAGAIVEAEERPRCCFHDAISRRRTIRCEAAEQRFVVAPFESALPDRQSFLGGGTRRRCVRQRAGEGGGHGRGERREVRPQLLLQTAKLGHKHQSGVVEERDRAAVQHRFRLAFALADETSPTGMSQHGLEEIWLIEIRSTDRSLQSSYECLACGQRQKLGRPGSVEGPYREGARTGQS